MKGRQRHRQKEKWTETETEIDRNREGQRVSERKYATRFTLRCRPTLQCSRPSLNPLVVFFTLQVQLPRHTLHLDAGLYLATKAQHRFYALAGDVLAWYVVQEERPFENNGRRYKKKRTAFTKDGIISRKDHIRLRGMLVLVGLRKNHKQCPKRWNMNERACGGRNVMR